MAKKTMRTDPDYEDLLSDLLAIKASVKTEFSRQAKETLLRGYWKMGQRICRETVFKKGHTNRTGPILKHLAAGLMMEYSLLTRIICFYKIWPKKCPLDSVPLLTWSHCRQLISLSDAKERQFYLRQIKQHQWSVEALRRRIRNDYYQTVSKEQTTDDGSLAPLRRSSKQLYCYSGAVKKVVDGDTLLLDVDLGFHVRVSVRVRLRGINAPELTAKEPGEKARALAAQEFLSQRLNLCEVIVFQTFKIDIYGRYVADIFYLPGETDKELIFQKGVFLNQELVDQGMVERF